MQNRFYRISKFKFIFAIPFALLNLKSEAKIHSTFFNSWRNDVFEKGNSNTYMPANITKNDTIPPNNQDEPVFTIVEQQPKFPGGLEEMTQFILRNIRIPQDPRYANAQGTVYAQFIISKQGKVRDIKIVKGLNPGADLEAKNLISRMPDWIPGKQNGIPVNVQYTLPLRFQFKTQTKQKTKQP